MLLMVAVLLVVVHWINANWRHCKCWSSMLNVVFVFVVQSCRNVWCLQQTIKHHHHHHHQYYHHQKTLMVQFKPIISKAFIMFLCQSSIDQLNLFWIKTKSKVWWIRSRFGLFFNFMIIRSMIIYCLGKSPSHTTNRCNVDQR